MKDAMNCLYSDPSKTDQLVLDNSFLRACLKTKDRFDITVFFMNKALDEDNINFGRAFRILNFCQREALIPTSSVSADLDPDDEKVLLWKKFWISDISVTQHLWSLCGNYDWMAETVRGVASYALGSLKIFSNKNILEHEHSYVQLREACDNLRIIKRQTYEYLNEKDKSFVDESILQLKRYEALIYYHYFKD